MTYCIGLGSALTPVCGVYPLVAYRVWKRHRVSTADRQPVDKRRRLGLVMSLKLKGHSRFNKYPGVTIKVL